MDQVPLIKKQEEDKNNAGNISSPGNSFGSKTNFGSGNRYSLASSELQGPRPPLVNGDNSKIFLVVKILVLAAIIGFGAYYFYIKNTIFPVPVSSPTSTVNLSVDTDNDGLPDSIEIAVGTDMNKTDTDGDIYTDSNEIKNGYSPFVAGTAGKYTEEGWNEIKGKILAASTDFYAEFFREPDKKPGWVKYQSDDFWFEIYYPKDWVFNYPADRSGYMEFKKFETSQEFVSLAYFENEDAFKAAYNVSLEDYYKKAPIVEKKEIVSIGANKFQKLIIHDCPKAGSNCTKYFLINNGHIYQFLQEAENPIINEIISTFKII